MIEINNLCKAFGTKTIVKDFSMKIEDGDFVVLSGKSGCGKTTMLNMIGAIESMDSGEILVDGKNIANSKYQKEYFLTKVGFLFQNFALIENKTVKQNLEIVKNKCRAEISINEALEKVGLNDKLDSKVYKLSGGEQQRVALARLMIKKCDIILADEPTGSLDKENAKIVVDMLKYLNEQGKTVILVTHDEEIKKIGKRVVNI